MGTLAVHWGWLDTVPGFPDRVVCENSAEQALREAAPAARPADARCAGLRRAPRQPSASASVAD